MNPDLAMGGDLLKKTGTGNLFMVFGEPDVEIRRVEDDAAQVVIQGLTSTTRQLARPGQLDRRHRPSRALM